jgi:cytochrome c oxidase cbb3-type subunit 3
MTTEREKDSVTGTETTGHEWDGIRELDTPPPSWLMWIFYLSIVFAAVYVVLYPAIPLGGSYTKGTLGYSSREALDESMARLRKAQGRFLVQINAKSPAEILKDPQLRTFAARGGLVAFGDNCAACHNLGGTGRQAYPSLADDVWLWGGKPADIYATLKYGIRSGHDKTRTSAMLPYGTGQKLTEPQTADVAEYVLSLTKQSKDAAAATRGAVIYGRQCASCHGKSGGGDQKQGAPALNDQIWLYGGTKAEIVAQIVRPTMGVMPAWIDRLPDETLKMLTVYVHALGGGK